MKWFEPMRNSSPEAILEISRKHSVRSTQFELPFLQWAARGSVISDKNKKKFIDFTSGVGWYNLGHNHPRLQAVAEFFGRHDIANLPDHDWPNTFAAFLKKKLCEITPGDFQKKVFLGRGGTEAIECALKICREHGPTAGRIFGFEKAFHGRTKGALELNWSKEVQRRGFIGDDASADRAYPLPFPERGHDCDEYKKSVCCDEKILGMIRFQSRALFFEPVQGEGGINVGCFSCLPWIIETLRSFGALIVADEIQTGMMRTGTMFACEQYGIIPDIICLSKSLCPGNHLSAVVVRADFDFKEGGRNSNTGVSALNCAIALETIEVLEELAEPDETGLKRKINILSTFAPEGLGMMRRIACESAEKRNEIVRRAMEAVPTGLILLGAGEKNIRLMPPLTIGEEELRQGIEILEKIL